MAEVDILNLEARLRELEEKFLSIDSLAQDVAQCRTLEEQLEARLQFESLITEISTTFINLLPTELQRGINLALSKVAAFTGAGRCYVFILSEDGTFMTNTHEYCVAGMEPRLDRLRREPVVSHQWLLEKLSSNGVVRIEAECGLSSGDDDIFINPEVLTSVIVGFFSKKCLTGFIGFDWQGDVGADMVQTADMLTVLGPIIANALERKKMEDTREKLISELRRTQEKLLTLSVRDQLTGLFNRRHMEESLAREISRAVRHKTSLAVIMLDLDYFKRINDTFGHMAGDVVLKAVGCFLQERSRGEDVVCRYGGEEFVIIMPGASLEAAGKRAVELCLAAGTLEIKYRDENLPRITVSLGTAAYPQHGDTAALLLYKVDKALYQAKQAGRNRVVAAD
ncbi:diguanylate cyclase [Desulfobacterota bacterium M19]